MSTTKIEWTEATWNPVTGCTKVSKGCQNCYAEKMANRLKLMGQAKYENGFKVTTHEAVLAEPESWRRPRIVFVCSMADLFHDDVTDGFIKRVFEVMNDNGTHTFQVLTKRPERLAKLAPQLEFTDNIWVGATVEHADYVERVDLLRTVPAAVRFLSCEPLLGSLTNLDLEGIDWVIVGGESGPGARPIDEQWVRELRDKCEAEGPAFFFKQHGGVRDKGGCLLDGKRHKEWPTPRARQDRPTDDIHVVGSFHPDFSDVRDDDIAAMLARAASDQTVVTRLVLEQPMQLLASGLQIPPNVHVGVRVDGDTDSAERMVLLSRIEAETKFIVLATPDTVLPDVASLRIDYTVVNGTESPLGQTA